MARMALWALGLMAVLGAARAEETHPLAGSWSGTLKAGTRSVPATSRFSNAGRPIYDYQAKAGARSAELTRKGQSLRFVPPGGGVSSVTVTDYSVTSGGFRYQLKVSHERTRGAIRSHETATITVEGKLKDGELAIEMKVATKSAATAAETGFTSSTSATAVAPEQTLTLKGTLKKK